MTAPAQQIYANIPRSNHLGLMEHSIPNYKKIKDFLKFTKDEVSRATGVPKNSIRDDGRMPQELLDRFTEIATVCELVAQQFSGDIEKTVLWFKLPNPLLGNIAPRDMIRMGRFRKLMKFIYDAQQGY